MALSQLPPGFDHLWTVREDLFRVRVEGRVWKAILLADLDRPLVRGQLVQLQARSVGPGVYEITVKPKVKAGAA